MLHFLLLLSLNFYHDTYADDRSASTEEKPHQKSCALEYNSCAVLKKIDLEALKLAKANKNPSRSNKEDLLVLTRCLFRQEVPVSDVCKEGLQKTLSDMSWFQRRIFNNLVL